MRRLRNTAVAAACWFLVMVLAGCGDSAADSLEATTWANVGDFVAEFIRSIAVALVL